MKIEKCHICGSQALWAKEFTDMTSHFYRVVCLDCHTESPSARGRYKAWRAWNDYMTFLDESSSYKQDMIDKYNSATSEKISALSEQCKLDKNSQRLFDLMKENPDLPVIPLIQGDIVCDDDLSIGNLGASQISDYAVVNGELCLDKREYVDAKFKENIHDLCESFNYNPDINRYTFAKGRYTKEQYESNLESRKKINEHLEKLAEQEMKKVIFVCIIP